MSDKHLLRKTRSKTVINRTSKKQENDINQAISRVRTELSRKYSICFSHESNWKLSEIVDHLKTNYPEVEFFYNFSTSSIRPDGGVLFMLDNNLKKYPVLIAEVKNQGTNDIRKEEGLGTQAKGNAIERLGKNVIGLRTALITESIFPFVCFGYGCDFSADSSILDRVVTIAMFGKLNTTCLHNLGENGKFNRGSFYFRERKWTIEEMYTIAHDIAERSIMYYFSKYRQTSFAR